MIKQIDTGKTQIIAVKVPEGITGWAVGNGCVYFNSVGVKLIPYGNYEPLGLSTELTEEQCKELVSKCTINGYSLFGYIKDRELHTKDTAKEAFASLMQANGINEPHLIIKRLS